MSELPATQVHLFEKLHFNGVESYWSSYVMSVKIFQSCIDLSK